jgi:hypothetical protein
MVLTYCVMIIGLYHAPEGYPEVEPLSAFLLGRDDHNNVYTSFYTGPLMVPKNFVDYYQDLPALLDRFCRQRLADNPKSPYQEILASTKMFLEGAVPFRIYQIKKPSKMEL